MTKKILLRLFILIGMISCNNTDENEITNKLNGKWNLVNVSCECQPVDLETGEHIWTFDLSKNKLYVINNVAEQLHTIFDTGTYNITVTGNKVTILAITYDYYFKNEKLFLADHPESDGPLIKFVKD